MPVRSYGEMRSAFSVFSAQLLENGSISSLVPMTGGRSVCLSNSRICQNPLFGDLQMVSYHGPVCTWKKRDQCTICQPHVLWDAQWYHWDTWDWATDFLLFPLVTWGVFSSVGVETMAAKIWPAGIKTSSVSQCLLQEWYKSLGFITKFYNLVCSFNICL